MGGDAGGCGGCGGGGAVGALCLTLIGSRQLEGREGNI